MNKKVSFVISCIGFISLIIIAILGYNYLTDNNYSQYQNNNKIEEGGSVMNVTSKNFEQEVLKSDKPVLIDFYATWCGPCKMISPIMEQIQEENDDIKVVKIDVDQEPGLATQYGVTSIPTIVAIRDGETVNTLIGLRDKEDILDMLK